MGDAAMRRIHADEWRELRDVRLRALENAPDAFGSTLAREEAFPEEDWQEWARDGAAGASEVLVLAWDREEPVGMAGAFLEEGRDHAHLIAMWVAPAARRQGLGTLLVEAIVDWAAEIGVASVRLDVFVGNEDALGLYRRRGFLPTGRSLPPFRDRPQLKRVELERTVSPPQ